MTAARNARIINFKIASKVETIQRNTFTLWRMQIFEH